MTSPQSFGVSLTCNIIFTWLNLKSRCCHSKEALCNALGCWLRSAPAQWLFLNFCFERRWKRQITYSAVLISAKESRSSFATSWSEKYRVMEKSCDDSDDDSLADSYQGRGSGSVPCKLHPIRLHLCVFHCKLSGPAVTGQCSHQHLSHCMQHLLCSFSLRTEKRDLVACNKRTADLQNALHSTPTTQSYILNSCSSGACNKSHPAADVSKRLIWVLY